MAKPRVFVSSTYYDLQHIRERLERFIGGLGYEGVLSEHGDIPYDPGKPLDKSCYEEVANCQILVLIIGGRYGSPQSGESRPEGEDLEKMYTHYNSVTSAEYREAREQDMPVYVFVEAGVAAEYETFKKNRKSETIDYAHVDSVNIFWLLDEIARQSRNNATHVFHRYDDIEGWLRDQWAGLFTTYLTDRSKQKDLRHLTAQLDDLEQVVSTLKSYSEVLLRVAKPGEADAIVEEQASKEREHRLLRLRENGMVKTLIVEFGIPAENVLELLTLHAEPDGFFTAIGFEKVTEEPWDDAYGWWARSTPDGEGKYLWNGGDFHTLRAEFA